MKTFFRILRVVVALFVVIVLVLVVVPLLWPTGWDTEEYAVYGALIEDYFIAPREPDPGIGIVVIEDQTDFRGWHKWKAQSDFGPRRLLTWVVMPWVVALRGNLDLGMKNRETFRLCRSLVISKPYVLYPRERVLEEPFVWHQDYEKALGLLTFSRVGFNWKKDRAVVYVDFIYGGLAGEGFYAFLEKEGGRWKLRETQGTWIS